MDPKTLDPAARAYFDALPPVLRENIVQSGADLKTKNDLERYLQNSLADAACVDIREP